MDEVERSRRYKAAYELLCSYNDSWQYLVIWNVTDAALRLVRMPSNNDETKLIESLNIYLTGLVDEAKVFDKYRTECQDVLNQNLDDANTLQNVRAVHLKATRYGDVFELMESLRGWLEYGYCLSREELQNILFNVEDLCSHVKNLATEMLKFLKDDPNLNSRHSAVTVVTRELEKQTKRCDDMIEVCFGKVLPQIDPALKVYHMDLEKYNIMDRLRLPMPPNRKTDEQFKRNFSSNCDSMLFGEYRRKFMDVQVDGWFNNCMFESLSLGIFDDTCRAVELRYRTIIEALTNDKYRAAVTSLDAVLIDRFYRRVMNATLFDGPSHGAFLRYVATLTNCDIFVATQNYYVDAEPDNGERKYRGPREANRHAIYGDFIVSPFCLSRADPKKMRRPVYLAMCDPTTRAESPVRDYAKRPCAHIIHLRPLDVIGHDILSDFKSETPDYVKFMGLRINSMELDDYSHETEMADNEDEEANSIAHLQNDSLQVEQETAMNNLRQPNYHGRQRVLLYWDECNSMDSAQSTYEKRKEKKIDPKIISAVYDRLKLVESRQTDELMKKLCETLRKKFQENMDGQSNPIDWDSEPTNVGEKA